MQENEQEKSPIKQRILLFLANKGISPYEFYKNSGVTRGILAQNNGISEDNLNRFISYFPTVNLVWLMSGCGDMEIKADSTAGIVDIQNKQQEISPMHNPTSLADDLVARHKPQLLPVKEKGAIPLVSEKAVGGLSNGDFSIAERDVIAYYTVPKFRNRGVDFMIEVTGDSMIPRFSPGDIIACSIITNPSFIQWNKCHLIASREQGLIVKRLMPGENKDSLKAVSDNLNYPPFDIPKEDICGLALIVGSIHLE